MFNAFARALALSSLVLGLASCSKSSRGGTAAAATTTLSGSVQSTGSGYSGTGSLIYNTPLESVQSGHSWALTFTLQDGGSLTLHSNTNNQLGNGIAIRFTRTGNTLGAKLMAAGAETDVSPAFADTNEFNASGSISLQIDIHNDESPAHVLVWKGTDFSEGAATLNADGTGPGSGSGTFWGIELDNATVSSIERTSPKLEE